MKNLSAESTNKLYAWLPHDLEAEEIVILPDACLDLLDGYINEVERFSVIAYMGHL